MTQPAPPAPIPSQAVLIGGVPQDIYTDSYLSDLGDIEAAGLAPLMVNSDGLLLVGFGSSGGTGVPILITSDTSGSALPVSGTPAPQGNDTLNLVVSGLSGESVGNYSTEHPSGPTYAVGADLNASAILTATSYDSTVVPMLSDSSGNLLVNIGASSVTSFAVAGTVATGSAAANKPVLVAGSDGTDVRNLLTDSGGQLKVLVENTSIAVTGTFYQATQPVSNSALNFDGSGNLKVNVEAGGSGGGAVWGPNASGAAPSEDPVLNAGWDGTDVRTLFTDSSGQLKVLVENSPTVTAVGAAAAGAAPSGNPVTVAGWDGTDVRLLLTDNTGIVQVGGSVIVAGAVADGSPPSTAPVVVAGYDGADVRYLLTDTTGQVKVLVENSPAVTVSSGTITAVTAITDAVTVVGNVAAGSGISGDPVQIAGSDGTDVRRIATDTLGNVSTITTMNQILAANTNVTPSSTTTSESAVAAVSAACVAVTVACTLASSSQNPDNICVRVRDTSTGMIGPWQSAGILWGTSSSTLYFNLPIFKGDTVVIDIWAPAGTFTANKNNFSAVLLGEAVPVTLRPDGRGLPLGTRTVSQVAATTGGATVQAAVSGARALVSGIFLAVTSSSAALTVLGVGWVNGVETAFAELTTPAAVTSVSQDYSYPTGILCDPDEALLSLTNSATATAALVGMTYDLVPI